MIKDILYWMNQKASNKQPLKYAMLLNIVKPRKPLHGGTNAEA